MGRTLQRIFQQHFSTFAHDRSLPPHWYRAANKIARCRTAALGGHVQSCEDGHVERIWYNSCRHRTCSQCNRMQMDRWLHQQTARLLNCSHHHIIFTIPHEFNLLWMRNTPLMMELLFHCARDSLQQLLADERRLGHAEPGFMLALHTWGRSLSLHPHLHCLITDGGLSTQGWQQVPGSCFVPARVLMAKFRGKFIAMLRKKLICAELILPDDLSLHQLQNTLNKLGRTKWNVHIRERYGHGNGVMQYLARYVRGGPMRSDQVSAGKGNSVLFRYTPHIDSETACRLSVMQLSADSFLRRYLQHVPEHRKHTVRSYGIYAPKKSAQLNRARAAFKQAPIERIAKPSWQAYYQQYAKQPQAHVCPICSKPVMNRRRITPHHDPPKPRTNNEEYHA